MILFLMVACLFVATYKIDPSPLVGFVVGIIGGPLGILIGSIIGITLAFIL